MRCREVALKSELQLMMVREPPIHAEMLVQGAFRAAFQQAEGRITVVPDPSPTQRSQLRHSERVRRAPKRRRR